MKANAAPVSVADYCADLNTGKIMVNEEYQRRQGVWNTQARSYFIESILLQFPIPKIFLYAKLDLKSRQVIKEIVDGQQRSQALQAFYNNKLKLSSQIETLELRGKRYSELSDQWKSDFLSYSLPVDQFSGVPEDDVQEAFRRMNANNVPLNNEEQRNAKFQGPFKWFIIKFAEQYQRQLQAAGVFSKRDLLRMVDHGVYSEVILAMTEGFMTVKSKQIDDLYKKYNVEFQSEATLGERLSYGVDRYLDRSLYCTKPFTRHHLFSTIVLAEIEKKYNIGLASAAASRLPEVAARVSSSAITFDVIRSAIEAPEDYPQLFELVQACTQKTNVESTKMTRFLYFLKASVE